MLVCGLLAGLAGAIDVLGWQFRINTNDIQILAGRLHRHRGRAARAQHGARRRRCRRCCSARLVSGTSQRNLDPTIFEPELAANLTLIIQGLVVLIVSADVLVLGSLYRARRGLRAARSSAAQAPPRRR